MLTLTSRDVQLLANAALTEVQDLESLANATHGPARRHRDTWLKDAAQLRGLAAQLLDAGRAQTTAVAVAEIEEALVRRMAAMIADVWQEKGTVGRSDLLDSFDGKQIDRHFDAARLQAKTLLEARKAA